MCLFGHTGVCVFVHVCVCVCVFGQMLQAPDYSELSMEVSVQVPNDGAKLVSVRK